MAETVLSMASSLVGSAASKAAAAASEEISLVMGVQQEMWYIKDELKTMQAFLRAAEVMKEKDELLKVWAEQVRDLSYDIEDCLDEFKVHVHTQSRSHCMMMLRDRHRIAIQIRNLKSRVEQVSNRNTRYNLIKPISSSSIDDRDSYMEDLRNQAGKNINEAALVGFDVPKAQVLQLIDVFTGDGPTKVIGVVGMGGLGKTTLARKVYESKDIVDNISCRAWITVSQSFDRKEMLEEMIRQLLGDRSLKDCLDKLPGKVAQVRNLSDHLRRELNDKRYFVVLDDLWAVDAWNWIKTNVFPESNDKSSRIVVTTRDVNVAERCTSSPDLVHHLKKLQINDAKELLLRKTKKSQDDIKKDNLEEIFDKILKKCGGLPLVIITVGGVLTTKHVEKWEILYNQLPSELESNPSLGAMRRVVTLSYKHLPSHLKPCFLYLSIFPEDFEIQRRRLVDRWIAEGLVRDEVGRTIEEVGNRYLNELINRSMIQPSKLNMLGEVKSCRVHDIIHDIAISISREENFVFLTKEYGITSVPEKIRHIAFHETNCSKLLDWSRVRSLTMFGKPMDALSSFRSSQPRMLRILDLQNISFNVTQHDINKIGLLHHLKYLSISDYNSYIYALPRSIRNLQGLRTLDIRNAYITKFPSELTTLQSLCSLRCSHRDYYDYFDPVDRKECLVNTMCLPLFCTPLVDPDDRARVIAELHMGSSLCWKEGTCGVKMPKGIGHLKELQVLEFVDIQRSGNKIIQELGELTQLSKLRVSEIAEKQGKKFCATLKQLSSLCSLQLGMPSGSMKIDWLDSVSSPPPHLRSLKLRGYLGEMPNWVGKLSKLTKIYLSYTKLKEGEAWKVLQTLPNLMRLRLSYNSYIGEKLMFGMGAFPKLRVLQLAGLKQLREVAFEAGASLEMESIIIWDCKLGSGIIGIKHLPRLKEISLQRFAKVAELDMLEREMEAHPNHPELRMRDSRSQHDLGKKEGSEVRERATASRMECRVGGDGVENAGMKLRRSKSCTATTSSLEHQSIGFPTV